MDKNYRARRTIFISFALAVFILGSCWPLFHSAFLNYDDPDYVTENPQVQMGLSLGGVGWAFTTGHASNWHPITWLSHMADVQFFGNNSGMHHAVNLLLHCLNCILLFVLLQRMTGATWCSGMAAALFGVHPMHIESVAWISERKDVLSGLFFMLTLYAYSRYAEIQNPGRESRNGVPTTRKILACELRPAEAGPSLQRFNASTFQRLWFLAALSFFALGLMCKPMLVTVPFLLLLLDYWPLRRPQFEGRATRKLLFEKLPFLLISVASSVITVIAQRSGGAMAALNHVSLSDRAGNALVSYFAYLRKMVWPTKLAIIYPLHHVPPLWQVVVAAMVLVLISGFVIAAARRRQFLLTGWFWYLGMLVPVIGLVQVGAQAMADRYTYLPCIGLFIVVIWSLATVFPPNITRFATVVGLFVVGGLAVVAHRQARTWQDSTAVFEHALTVTADNYIAHFCLANALIEEGQIGPGMEHLRQALQINPGFAEAHCRVAYVLAGEGRTEEAIASYREALRIKPDLAQALNNLAWTLATDPEQKLRNGPEAVRLAEKACELTKYRETLFVGTLAAAYAEAGEFSRAITAAERTVAGALKWNQPALAAKNRELLQLYQAGVAYHEPPRTPRSNSG